MLVLAVFSIKNLPSANEVGTASRRDGNGKCMKSVLYHVTQARNFKNLCYYDVLKQ